MPLAFAVLVTVISFLFLIVLLMIVRKAADLPNDTIVYQVNILALGAIVFTALAGLTGTSVWPNFPVFNPANSSDWVKKSVLASFLAISAIATACAVLHAKRMNNGERSKRLTAAAYALSAMSVITIMTSDFIWN